MASLRQEHHYGLCGGKSNRTGSSATLYHVKLTDTAIKALEAFQNIKGSLQNEPSICFKGNQGYIKIPAPTQESPSALRVFSFYLSSDSKDQPQASFDCVHQYVSSDGREQLEGQGTIQDKITVCATDDSYQMTRERMSQVEKDSWSRSAIEIKPGATHPSKCVKFQKRPAQPCASDSGFYKHPANTRRPVATPTPTPTPTQKPLRERIVHLLALKAFRKPELLLWLERERAGPKDKAELGPILDQVAKVNPKDSSYVLKDDFYRLVQRDWPRYTEEERQSISRLLARKLQPHISNQSRNLPANTLLPKMSEEPTLHQNTAKNPPVKRPVPFDSIERLAVKRQRLVDQRLQQQQQPAVNGLSNNKGQHVATPSLNPSFHTKTEFQRTTNHIGAIAGSPGVHSGSTPTHKLSIPSDTQSTEKEAKVSSHQAPKGDSDRTDQQLTSSQHKKKKSKKHKDKERERLKDDTGGEWLETSPDLKKDKFENPDITHAVASEEKPDYVLSYGAIMSVDQRQRYQEDFCSEYDEYKNLHSRIASITHMFVQLASKIKSLSPGTQEYKIMEDQILEKYKKYRKKFPGYREEKKRCEYLHEKLSYIKQLIIDYDRSQASS